MRDLNECTAEVFRRSEKRIKERRKNHSRVLAVCIPVCLIAAVGSAIIFPPMLLAEEISDRAQVVGESAMSGPESIACPYTAVEIRESGMFPEEYSGNVTDPAAVTEMFRAIHLFFADTDSNDMANGGNLPLKEEPGANDLTDAASNRTDCSIIFTAEDGSQAVYHLSENTLVNVSTNETVSLSDSQTAGLMAVLGLSE